MNQIPGGALPSYTEPAASNAEDVPTVHAMNDKPWSQGVTSGGKHWVHVPDGRVKGINAGNAATAELIVRAVNAALAPIPLARLHVAAVAVFHVMGHDQRMSWGECTSAEKELYVRIAHAVLVGVTPPEPAPEDVGRPLPWF